MSMNVWRGGVLIFFLVVNAFEFARSTDCNSSSVGLRDTNGIPYYQFQGSSYSSSSFRKELNKDGEVWCPDPTKARGSYLEVDLGSRYSLCAVSVQGSDKGHVTQFKLSLSLDRVTWTPREKNTSEIVFLGNSDATDTVRHNFSSQQARFVRFYPVSQKDDACMKVELYGKRRPKETCEKTPLMQNLTHRVTASSNFSVEMLAGILNGTQSWCGYINDTNPFLQIDLGSHSVICAAEVQSINFINIQISYSVNETWVAYRNLTNQANAASKVHIFSNRIMSRYIRFKPLESERCFNIKTVRLYGYSYGVLLNEDVGLKYGSKTQWKYLPDQSFATSKEQFQTENPPSAGRLYTPTSSWCPLNQASPQYIELILVEKHLIFAVSVQGFWETFDEKFFAKQYTLSYSNNYQDWRKYPLQNQINIGLDNVIDKHILQHPIAIEARILRIEIPSSNVDSCVKVELHGISTIKSGFCKDQYPLGLSNQGVATITDGSITAPSNYGRNYRSKYARLRNGRCWCAMNYKGQYINIDLEKMVTLTGVATQGCSLGYVTQYEIKYSYDGVIWYDYIDRNVIETFQGNSAKDDDIFSNWLNTFVITKYIQIKVANYTTLPCLRLELYGCTETVGTPSITTYATSETLNRTENSNITLTCVIRGQPGMVVTWARSSQMLQSSSFEKYVTTYPSLNKTSGVVRSNLTISYHSDKDIYNNFNCVKSNHSSRILLCSSVYECSANYPGATIMSQTVTVTVTPNIVLPDVPGKPWVYNVKSQSARISWNASGDYRESRLEAYVIYLSDESGNVTRELNITSGLNNKTLTVSFANLSEFTTYHAKVAAVNAIKKSNFTEPVPFLTLLRATVSVSQSKNLQVKENEKNISIACTGMSYPTPYVTWKKNGTELTRINSTETANRSIIYQLVVESKKDNKTRSTLQVTSTLFLRPDGIKFQDYGNYTCEVLNINESNVPLRKGVEILFPPRLLKKPESRTILEGENISLTCRAEGPPPPTITWYIVGEGVTMKNTTDENATVSKLFLTNVKSTGRYNFTATCSAISKGGEANASAVIEIYVKPRIINLTKSFTEILYRNVTLKCEILANPSPQVWWTKDDIVLQEHNIDFKNGNKTLIITRADLNNIGDYSCFARNNLSATNKSLHLSLKALPIAYIEGTVEKLMKGQQNVSTICRGYGYPEPKATWKLNGSQITENSGRNDVHQEILTNVTALKNVSSVLYFNQSGAQFKDFGNYSCEVSIESTAKDIPDTKILEVIFYPVVNVGPSDATILEGNGTIFNCEVDGRPVPSTSWQFQNKSISANHTVLPNGSLVLYSVRNTKEFEGTYSCFANNKAGQSQMSSAVLNVHVPAKIVFISETDIHQLKENVTLNCSVAGDPFPYVTWTKFNYSTLSMPKFVLADDNQTLTIKNISLREQGTYTCTARNEYREEQKNVKVDVEVRPIAEVNSTSTIYLKSISDRVIISCDGKGYPNPVVRWFRNGTVVSLGNANSSLDVYQIIVNSAPIGFLGPITSILYVNPDQTYRQFGNYTCNVTKSKDNELDLEHVEIVLIPNVTVDLQTTTVLEKTNVTFKCTADGSPEPYVVWSRHNGSIPTQSITLGSSLLVLRNVTNHDEGIYTCTAKNKGDPVMVNATLIVHVKPRISTHLEDEDVQNGTSYMLNCSASGDPSLIYTWTKDDRRNIPNSKTIDGNKTLVISPVNIDNEGTYVCTVANIEGNDSTKASITVFARPKILDFPKDATLNETQTASFYCGGNGIPTPDVIWRKNNGSIIPGSTHYNISSQNGTMNIKKSTLVITDLKYSDRGNYSCTLRNRKANKSASAVLTVYVRPIASITGPKKMVKIGESVNFTCVIYGFPQPNVSWNKNGIEISRNGHYHISLNENEHEITWNSSLRVDQVWRNDTANYSCHLINAAGTDDTVVPLVVLERPDPLNASITHITPRSIALEWQVIFNGNSEIQSFNLSYAINGEDTLRSIQFRSNVTRFTAKFLKPWTWYNFSITAKNNIGTSAAKSISKKTLEDTPTSPENVRVTSLSSFALNVTWSPPQEKNGVIKYYLISYYRGKMNQSKTLNVSADLRSQIITGLKPFTNYTIQIEAYTSAGAGNKSDPFVQQTNEAAPSKPLNLQSVVQGNTSIRLTWTSPEHENGIIRVYTIYYKMNNTENNTERNLNVSGATNERLVEYLRPFTSYIFWVQAYTSAGGGNLSETVTNMTREGVPSEPLDLKSTVLSNTSISLTWSAPKYTYGIILGYYVFYKGTTTRNSPLLGPIHTNDSVAEINGLQPFTNYTFWVRGYTSAGRGNRSTTISNMTSEGIPTEPQNLSKGGYNSTSISLSWSEPEKLRGILDKYVIYYRKKGKEEKYFNKTSGKNPHWTITSLESYTEYDVYVQAFTSAGGGNWSEPLTAKTDVGAPVTPKEPPDTFIPTGDDKKNFDPSTMAAVVLPSFPFTNGPISFYRIFVFVTDETFRDTKLEGLLKTVEIMSYDDWKKLENKVGKPYLAFQFKGSKFDDYKYFVVGDGKSFSSDVQRKKRSTDGFKNGKLEPNTQYEVFVRAHTSKDKYASSQPLTVNTAPLSEERDPGIATSILIVIIIAGIIVIVLFGSAVWFRLSKSTAMGPLITEGQNVRDGGMGVVNLGHPVPLPELGSYVQSKAYSDEFQGIPKIVNREVTIASTSVNMQKNRYKNILPYDYSRVRLARREDGQESDYINASYIKGMRFPSKYIATQGPLPSTTNDFWRMVWEQECSVIVMLTGLEEDGKVKCYQYWPATPIEKAYGDVAVRETGQVVLADYTVRYFVIKELSTGLARNVQHLHFTAWPDHGVPRYPGPLLHFHSRFRAALVGSHPVIVHCSAGCGRTGTFIALDYTLQKLDEQQDTDRMVDFLHFVREMRGQRLLMVQTEEQYIFIHNAVLEAVTFAHTEISAADVRVKSAILKETIRGTRKTKAKEEFENLQKRVIIQPCEEGSSTENEKKNRCQVVPFDYNRVLLEEMAGTTDYINASFIFGYQKPNSFIATQTPLPHTVNDFWRMVFEQNCAVIVCISTIEEQDQFGVYWPNEGLKTYGAVAVALDGVNEEFADLGIVIRKFKLTKTQGTKGNSSAVMHFHFTAWPRDNFPTAQAMLQLLAEVQRAQRSSGNNAVTVHCSDGTGRTGTFCAIVSSIERVKLENSVDLVMNVRNLQAQRPGMVQNEMQYVFCYEVIAAFLTSFDDQMYDNFKHKEESGEDLPSTSLDGKSRMVTKC